MASEKTIGEGIIRAAQVILPHELSSPGLSSNLLRGHVDNVNKFETRAYGVSKRSGGVGNVT